MTDWSAEFQELADAGGPARRFNAGDVIFKRGDAAQELFVIQNGKVEIHQTGRVIAAFSDHDVFGEMALIDSSPRSATAVAATDTILIPVGKNRFLSLVRNSPDMAIKLMRILTQRLRETARENQLLNIEAITASIAHEVRQPLDAIAISGGAALRFLRMEPPNLDEVRSLLEAIRKDSHRAVELLEGMRNLFRRAGEERQAINVNEVAREVLESLKERLQSHGIISKLDLSSEVPIVDGNMIQLRQVLFNLINNAFEAMSGSSGPIKSLRVSIEQSSRDMIAVKVRDTGPGIDSGQLEDIFDAFFTTKPHGTGLGLAISRMIIERHGGQLTASSGGESCAMFEFTLPIKSITGAA